MRACVAAMLMLLVGCGCGSDAPAAEPVALVVRGADALVTSEGGARASFEVLLDRQPDAPVHVSIALSAPDEVIAMPTTLVFDAATWDVAQRVETVGLDDLIADGDQPYIATLHDGLVGHDVPGKNLDDDVAAIIVSLPASLVTQETGASATIVFALASQPTADVVIELSSSAPDEGVVEPSVVTITPATWSTARTVRVIGIDDDLDDGTQPFAIDAAVSSADAVYAGHSVAALQLTNLDDDTPGFVITPMSGLETTEGGGTASSTVRLTTQPAADVTIGLAASAGAEVAIDTASVTFTPSTWNAPQTIVVTGLDDARDDGDIALTIATAVESSGDPAYASLDPSDVGVVNRDDDTAGIVVTPTSVVVREGGGASTFSIQLASQPSADVAIDVTSSRPQEALASVTRVSFTPLDWNVPQTVQVTPVDDAVEDGPQIFPIRLAPADSVDPAYAGRDAVDVTVTNLDDDCAHPHVTRC